PTPFCDFWPANQTPPFIPGAIVKFSVVDDSFGLALYWVSLVGCSDITLIHDARPRRDNYYELTVLPGVQARVYEDRFFRGPRKTVGRRGDLGYTFTSPASVLFATGETEANQKFLIWSRGCPNCNLSGLDFRGVDLHGTILWRADLSHASLEGADLS